MTDFNWSKSFAHCVNHIFLLNLTKFQTYWKKKINEKTKTWQKNFFRKSPCKNFSSNFCTGIFLQFYWSLPDFKTILVLKIGCVVGELWPKDRKKMKNCQLWPIFTTIKSQPTVSAIVFLKSIYSLVYAYKISTISIDAFKSYVFLRRKNAFLPIVERAGSLPWKKCTTIFGRIAVVQWTYLYDHWKIHVNFNVY